MSETKISSFDVLKRMSEDDLDIRLAASDNLRRMNLVHKGKDTDITIGVAGNVIGAIATNELHICLLIWNKEQYRATKAKIEKESKG
jgi:hypothetical protein